MDGKDDKAGNEWMHTFGTVNYALLHLIASNQTQSSRASYDLTEQKHKSVDELQSLCGRPTSAGTRRDRVQRHESMNMPGLAESKWKRKRQIV